VLSPDANNPVQSKTRTGAFAVDYFVLILIDPCQTPSYFQVSRSSRGQTGFPAADLVFAQSWIDDGKFDKQQAAVNRQLGFAHPR